jgi:ELWxxDGT repeat protein
MRVRRKRPGSRTPVLVAVSLLAAGAVGVIGAVPSTAAVAPYLVKDINPTGSADPNELVDVGGTLLFGAFDDVNGRELWRSDGTLDGTEMVADLNGIGESQPANFGLAGGTLVFGGHNDPGYTLWATDGTTVTELADVLLNSEISKPVGNVVTFNGEDGTSGTLWRSDGTVDGTYSLDIDLHGNAPVAANGYFLFEHDGALWRTDAVDGTPEHTYQLAEVSGITSGYTNVVVGDTVYFRAWDGGIDYSLWKTDGTSEGTVMVSDLQPEVFGRLGNKVVFTADDGTHGWELWISDGTLDGTTMVKDIDPVGGSSPGEMTEVGAELFFIADDGSGTGSELWKTDGTDDGTTMVKDINPGSQGSSPDRLTDIGGTLYFNAGGTEGRELWRSNGSETGTVLVHDVNPGIGSSNAEQFVAIGTTLFFRADGGATGVELWALQLATDEDGDGIDDDVDPTPTTAGNRFDDGVATRGAITQVPPGATVSISDSVSPSPNDGVQVVVTTTHPNDRVRIQLDGKATTVKYTAGTYLLTDPPAQTTVQTITGEATLEATVGGTLVEVVIPEGTTATITETSSGGTVTDLVVEVVSAESGSDPVTINGEPVVAGSELHVGTFTAKMTLKRGALTLTGVLTPSSSDGIDPQADGVTVEVDSATNDYAFAAPPGGFTLASDGAWTHSGSVGGVDHTIRLARAKGGRWNVKVTAKTVSLTTPVSAALRIGDDAGFAQIG